MKYLTLYKFVCGRMAESA